MRGRGSKIHQEEVASLTTKWHQVFKLNWFFLPEIPTLARPQPEESKETPGYGSVS